MKKTQNDRFIISVKVGPKGQITVPVEARKMFGIREGDTLMVMGDRQRGMALIKADAFYDMMGGMMPDDGNRDQKPEKGL
ncbi:MAG: AbrB/MazE/SpoVT family DNA-binding domain-containing protein [Clostridia bacterium]|nr:AbrB/MazE/SpoVT family DNA-binding domain-containing protein [Clostridia bacterium]